MGLISAARDAVSGTLADQWAEFITAPVFDEQTMVAPGVLERNKRGRRSHWDSSANIISDGSCLAVPEGTAALIIDGGRIVGVSTEPGYFVFRNDGQPSLFTGSGPRRSLIEQSWERFKFRGQPSQQQYACYVNLREIRGLGFGTPGPLPYKDFSLVPPGSTQAPVLRLRARGQYSVQVVDPIRFFRNFLPVNVVSYSLSDGTANAQLSQEFIAAFQAALQSLSRTTDIASIASHGTELATALTTVGGSNSSWLERFGLVVAGVAVSAIEYDETSREILDKYNRGVLLGGAVGNAYTQTTIADSLLAVANNGDGSAGMMGIAMGVGAIGGTLSGLEQPVVPPTPTAPAPADPVDALRQLKAMLDQDLITSEQYAAKQQEILSRM